MTGHMKKKNYTS